MFSGTLLAGLAVLAGCSRASSPRIERIALLPFGNLSGDANLDWLSIGAPAVLAEQLTGVPNIIIIRAGNSNEAAAAGASKLLLGSYSKLANGIGIDAKLEDTQSHQMSAVMHGEDSALKGLNTIAKAITPIAREFSTSNTEAVTAWVGEQYQTATTLDPDFGAAWLSWVGQLATANQHPQALEVARRALARSTLRTPFTKAQIELTAATLEKDMPRRRQALNALLNMAPNSLIYLASSAEAESFARRFQASADFYRQILAQEPNNGGALNGLGYAEALSGNFGKATEALQQYGKLPGQALNALDSQGEANFLNGRFKEAEQVFQQVSKQDPTFLGGTPLLKAAYARYLGGDLPGADSLMDRFVQLKKQQGDVAVAWRDAVWLYATGRKNEALAKLDTAPRDQKNYIDRQKSVWRGQVQPPGDLKELRQLYETTAPAQDGLPRVIYASALAKAGRIDEAKQLLHLWPLPDSAGDPLLQSLVYPEFLALRRELGVK